VQTSGSSQQRRSTSSKKERLLKAAFELSSGVESLRRMKKDQTMVRVDEIQNILGSLNDIQSRAMGSISNQREFPGSQAQPSLLYNEQ
jgi:hypothetical protein